MTHATGTSQVAEFPAVDRRYEISGLLGRGGVGEVYRARDKELGRDVALKVLHAELGDGMAERFFEEAQIGAQLQHPGIVPVYDVEFGAERPYFTMKLVEGRTLLEILRERTESSDDQLRLLRVFETICETIAYAHARGVVHRDLKPANVMVGAFGEVQTLDWGFAKVVGRTDIAPTTVRSSGDSQASVAGQVLGTPSYMAPEQALGELDALDERTDVFCLGAMLCEILTGLPPHTGMEGVALLTSAARGELEGAHGRIEASGADPELAALATRCLQGDKADRPADAGEVALSVSRYLASVEQRVRDAELAATAERVRAAQERRARRLTLVLAAVILLLGVGGVFAYWQHVNEVRDNDREVRALLDAAERHARRQDWALALENVRQAEARMERSTLPATTRDEVRLRSTSYGALARIYAVRYEEEIESAEVDDAYAAAFAELGLDVLALDAQTIGTAIARDHAPMRAELALALDDWASRVVQLGTDIDHRQRLDDSMVAKWRKLVEAADRADPDPWRGTLRTAALRKDGDELERLANEVKQESRPAESIVLLFHALQGSGRFPLAAEVLKAGAHHHPDDFWINFLLARLTGGRTSRILDWDSAVRHAAVAVALRPKSSDAHAAYGFLLLRRAKARGPSGTGADDARIQLETALELNPENHRASWGLVAAVHIAGHTERARQMARKLRDQDVRIPRGLTRMLQPGSKSDAFARGRRRGPGAGRAKKR